MLLVYMFRRKYIRHRRYYFRKNRGHDAAPGFIYLFKFKENDPWIFYDCYFEDFGFTPYFMTRTCPSLHKCLIMFYDIFYFVAEEAVGAGTDDVQLRSKFARTERWCVSRNFHSLVSPQRHRRMITVALARFVTADSLNTILVRHLPCKRRIGYCYVLAESLALAAYPFFLVWWLYYEMLFAVLYFYRFSARSRNLIFFFLWVFEDAKSGYRRLTPYAAFASDRRTLKFFLYASARRQQFMKGV